MSVFEDTESHPVLSCPALPCPDIASPGLDEINYSTFWVEDRWIEERLNVTSVVSEVNAYLQQHGIGKLHPVTFTAHWRQRLYHISGGEARDFVNMVQARLQISLRHLRNAIFYTPEPHITFEYTVQND